MTHSARPWKRINMASPQPAVRRVLELTVSAAAAVLAINTVSADAGRQVLELAVSAAAVLAFNTVNADSGRRVELASDCGVFGSTSKVRCGLL